MKDFFIYILWYGVFLLVSIIGYYFLITALTSDHILLSSIGPWFTPFRDIYFAEWVRPLIFAFGVGLIILSIIALSNLSYIIKIFDLIMGGNLTIEDGRPCLRNSGCKVKLERNTEIRCYKSNKLMFMVDITDLKYREIENNRTQLYVAAGTLFFLYLNIAILEFSRTSKAEDILNYCYLYLFRYQYNLRESISDIIKVKSNIKIDKLDINNATEKEINKLPGINVVMAKRLINKREEIKGFKTIDDVILYLHLKPHMIEILRPLICVNKMKISKAFIKNTDRRVDI